MYIFYLTSICSLEEFLGVVLVLITQSSSLGFSSLLLWLHMTCSCNVTELLRFFWAQLDGFYPPLVNNEACLYAVWNQPGRLHRSDSQRQILRRGHPEAGRTVRENPKVLHAPAQERGTVLDGCGRFWIAPRSTDPVSVRPQCFIEMDKAEAAEKMAAACKGKQLKFNGKRLTVYVCRKYKWLKHG